MWSKADLELVLAAQNCQHHSRLSSASNIQAAGIWSAGDKPAAVRIQGSGLQLFWCIAQQCIAQLYRKLTSLKGAYPSAQPYRTTSRKKR